ncbi:MAG: hypothetical protein NTZ68_00475 [Candidatus Dependentiae bacterium]|nr:hypothetical protein [Candidatus Dependentiae bacterium]
MNKNIKNYLALTMLCALFATLPVYAFVEVGEEGSGKDLRTKKREALQKADEKAMAEAAGCST